PSSKAARKISWSITKTGAHASECKRVNCAAPRTRRYIARTAVGHTNAAVHRLAIGAVQVNRLTCNKIESSVEFLPIRFHKLAPIQSHWETCTCSKTIIETPVLHDCFEKRLAPNVRQIVGKSG